MIRLLLAALVAVGLSWTGIAHAAASSRNILLIIADDYGIDATQYYPSTDRRTTTPPAPPTPNLRNLARQGLLFRNAWSQPSCSPTRATIITGRYGFRTGIGKPVPHDLSAPAPVLAASELTLPEAFRARPELGYYLAHIGKWHLGRGADDPNRQGWPIFKGPHPDLAKLEDFYRWTKVVNGVAGISTVYATTDQVNDTIAAIGEARAAGRPFFITLALSAPHSPYQKPPNDLHSRDSLPAGATSQSMRRPYYEAMIEAMDTELGRLLGRVDLATTTVIFLGDNGTPNEVIAKPYAADHAKLRVYEQGIRVPLIVAGAGVASPNRLVSALVNTVDLYPTILRLAGIDPATVLPAGRRIDGVSLLPLITTTSAAAVRPWAYADKFDLAFNEKWERAIRDGRYKLIERAAGLPWPVREFFDLQADPLEKNNLLMRSLTAAQRAKLTSLDGELDALLATR